MSKEVRLDKWLWAMRIYKTRSDAADGCRTGKVKVNGTEAKPSRQVMVEDKVSVRRGHITFTYQIVDLMDKRQPASKVEEYMRNVTPQSELDKMNVPRETVFVTRERGAGRPTKRDRRQVDDLMEQMSEFDILEDK